MPVLPAADDPVDLRLVPAAVAAWVVAWQGRLLPSGLLLGLGALAAVIACGLFASRPGGRVLVAAAACGCGAAAAVVTALHGGAREAGPLAALAAREAAVRVEAVVTDDPRRALTRAVPGARPLLVTRVRVERVVAGGSAYRLRAPVVVLSSDEAWLPLLPSTRVVVEGRLRPAERGDDVAAVLSGRGPPELLAGPSRLHLVAGSLRQGLRDAVAPLPEREQGLLPGLVVGDTSRLDPGVREDFRTVGLTHLTAVSGTNVAIVTGAVLLLCVRLRVGLRWRPVLAAVALLGFVVLARPSPSVLRAGAMGLVALVGLAAGGRAVAMPALATAVLVLVLADPDLAATPGFALSVLATAGLLLVAPRWRVALARRLPGWLADAVAVPAAAQVACGPVVVALSAELGLLSVPANLLAVPAVAPATIAGVGAALVAPVWLPAAQAVAWVGFLPTAWLVRVADTGAAVPGAALPWPSGAAGALLLAALTLAALPLLRRRTGRRALAAVTAGAVVATTGLAVVRPAWPPPGWVAVFCDVGQGDAVVLRAGSAAVLVDAGPDPAAVDRCLDRLDVRALPVVLLSHLHADHVDGLPGALDRPVGTVLTGVLQDPPEQAAEVRQQTTDARVQLRAAALGSVSRLGDLTWTVLAPARRFRGTSSDPNNSSLVVRAEVGGVRLLLTGDVEPEAQRDLLRRGADLAADVLKVPHHGSRHQDPAFLSAVGARVAVASVGAENTYGHPAPETTARLAAGGTRTWRTDLHGDVAVVVRAGRLLVVPARG